MKLSLYLTDDLYFFEEQVKAWRKEFSDVTIVTELSAANMQATPTLLGETLTVIRQDKLPAAKKMDAVIKLVKEHLDEDNVVLFFVKATRADKTGTLAKAFPEGRVTAMYSMTTDQKERYVDKHLPWVSISVRLAVALDSDSMDTRTFRSKVLQLEEIHATDADVEREFPKVSKGAVFHIANRAEEGTPEGLAKALRAVRECRLNGDEPMMILGAMHRTYRLSYKLAIHPNGRDAALKELGLSSYQAKDIPKLSAEDAKMRHKMVAEASASIRIGRDGFDAIGALISKISAAAGKGES